MVLGKVLLLVLLIAVAFIIAVTVVCAVLGSRRGQMEKWVRNGFTAALGLVFISGVVVAAALSIRALHDLDGSLTLSAYETPKPAAEYRRDTEQTARPVYTPPPGTIITPTPKPETIVGVNYGADYELTDCNDYVYVMEDATLYDGPGTDNKAVGSVSGGATINRKGYTGDGWSLVDYGGNYCFIETDVLIVNE